MSNQMVAPDVDFFSLYICNVAVSCSGVNLEKVWEFDVDRQGVERPLSCIYIMDSKVVVLARFFRFLVSEIEMELDSRRPASSGVVI